MFSFEFGRHSVRSLSIAAVMVAALLPGVPAHAQLAVKIQSAASPAEDVPLQFSGDNSSVPHTPSFHILPANTEAGRHASLDWPVPQARQGGAAKHLPLAGLPSPGFFPADMTYLGGFIIRSGGSVNIYYNCADESCWGDPEGFLFNLAGSKFIHIVDQYTNAKTNNRYPLSGRGTTGGSTTFASVGDIQAIVHSAAQQVGSHIFHVFLPQGVDHCMDAGNTLCYSPDNLSTFTFCAYHASVDFNDGLGPLIYTVEPFQDVSGCRLAQPPSGYPNGELADSTNSTLSHELFELITDPFGGAAAPAWVALNSSPEQGNEIGDICHGPGDGLGDIIAPTYLLVKGRVYQTQLEYSNTRHACVVAP
jgi:hypothetical protein